MGSAGWLGDLRWVEGDRQFNKLEHRDEVTEQRMSKRRFRNMMCSIDKNTIWQRSLLSISN